MNAGTRCVFVCFLSILGEPSPEKGVENPAGGPRCGPWCSLGQLLWRVQKAPGKFRAFREDNTGLDRFRSPVQSGGGLQESSKTLPSSTVLKRSSVRLCKDFPLESGNVFFVSLFGSTENGQPWSTLKKVSSATPFEASVLWPVQIKAPTRSPDMLKLTGTISRECEMERTQALVE